MYEMKSIRNAMFGMGKLNGITLTREQIDFICSDSKNILNDACPGSGKSTILEYRILMLNTFFNVPAESIAVIAYNNASVRDLESKRKKLTYMLKKHNIRKPDNKPYKSQGYFTTYHKFCNEWISDYWKELDIPKFIKFGDIVLSNERRKLFMKKAVEKVVGSTVKDSTVSKLLSDYDYFIENEHYLEPLEGVDWKKVFNLYERMKNINGVLDQSDSLKYFRKLVEDPEVCKRIVEVYPYIMFDEFQDTTKIIVDTLKMLNPYLKGFCAIGDGDQAIYGFRGTDHKTIFNIVNDFEDLEVLKLTNNMRCPSLIIDHANKILGELEDRRPKEIKAVKAGGVVNNFTYETKIEMVDKIIEEIETKSPEYLENTCIAYRNKEISHLVASKLLDKHIPFKVDAGYMPYKDELTISLLSILEMLKNPSSMYKIKSSLFKVIPSTQDEIKSVIETTLHNQGIEEESYSMNEVKFYDFKVRDASVKPMQKLRELSTKVRTDVPMQEYIMELYGILRTYYWDFRKKHNNFSSELEAHVLKTFKVKENYVDFEKNMSVKFSELSLMSEEGVHLTTFHSLKGLEYNHVIGIELEEGIFPSDSIQSDLRLYYVLCTRAKEKLSLYFSDFNASRFKYIHEEKQEVAVGTDRFSMEGVFELL